MNYKEKVIKLLEKFPNFSPIQLIKLERYYVEYLRELAIKNGVDPDREYKWTNKVIKMYSDKGYACVWEALTILGALNQSVALLNTHQDFMLNAVKQSVDKDEEEIMKCLLEALTK